MGTHRLVHGDLDARTLRVEDGGSAPSSTGVSGVGDPACDVMVVWKMLSADTRGIFRSALSIDDGTWARSRGWALSQALNFCPITLRRRTPCSSGVSR